MDSVLILASIVCLLLPVGGRRYARKRQLPAGVAAHEAWEVLSVLLIIAALVYASVRDQMLPMVTVQGGLQTLALIVGTGWLVLRRKERMAAAGTILLPLAGVLLATSLMEPPATVASTVGTPYFSVHFALVFLGLGGFALSFALSALFLFQRRRLKQKDLKNIGELPSLDTLDGLNFQTQCLGFVALTAGIAMGVFLVSQTDGNRGVDDITVWGTCAVWIWYAAGLHARVVLGWRGRTAAIFGVVGFGGLGLVLTVATVVLGGWHGA